MSSSLSPPERTRPAGVSELPLIVACRDCSLVGIWDAGDAGTHPHAEKSGHEVAVAGLGDLPGDRRITVPGGGRDAE